MKHRVYLGDWLFNAGIIGFIRIINSDIEKENVIQVDDNYIEFKRKILKGFSEKYFKTAFNTYGRYYKVKNTFEEFIQDILAVTKNGLISGQILKKYKVTPEDKKNVNEVIITKIHKRYKNIINGFKLLKDKSKAMPTKPSVINEPLKLKMSLTDSINILKNNFNEFFESDVQIYLRKIYGQKSFLNKTIKKDRLNIFKRDFEQALLKKQNKNDNILKCINCGNPAKKNLNFDTGISPFLGLNKDALNFMWNFNPKLPLCEICELIYFCYFAGLTDVSQGKDSLFYFVNNDSSVNNLVESNNLLKNLLVRNISENILVDFFTELILQEKSQQAHFTLQHIPFVELDLSKSILPKIYSLNIEREKAVFIRENSGLMKKISRTAYKIKDRTRYLLHELMNQIIIENINFNYCTKLLKFYLAYNHGKSDFYQTWYNPYHIQITTIMISKYYIQFIKRRNVMDTEKTLWNIYYKGKDLSLLLHKKDAKNKIPSNAYKLLNALRIGNVNKYMDSIFRICMQYDFEVPSIFIKSLADKESFNSYGYSFINGLLVKPADNKEKDNE